MEIYREKTPIQSLSVFQQQNITESMLFFDIETTGLSPAKDHIYCIGCGFRENDAMVTELYFASGKEEEAAVIDAFIHRLSGFKVLVTFNGTTFDIPFLRKKTEHLADDIFRHTAHMDLYREVRNMRHFLRLPSYKQKSIERFLGCLRHDLYSGGQLTRLYQKYVSCPDEQTKSLFLLHNSEDIKGMYQIFGILSYKELLCGNFKTDKLIMESDEKNKAANIRIIPNDPLPQDISLLEPFVSIHAKDHEFFLRYPIQSGELKIFFHDTENYYYLPDEDCAVHKSIGEFVAPAHRRRATRKTCYAKKICDYISIPAKHGESQLRKFYDDQNLYLDVNHMEREADALKSFILQTFRCL